MPVPIVHPKGLSDADQAAFDRDLKDVHLSYDYNVTNETGSAEKWRYEVWFFSSSRVVYAIHGGPMAGRKNFQTASFRFIREGELWQVNWLEETGMIGSFVYDIPRKRCTTMIAFPKGHWENNKAAHGDKRNPEDFQRWRELAKIGIHTDGIILNEQADIVDIFKGPGDLEPITGDEDTL